VANVFIKSQKVVNTMLGLLEREITLPQLVWRDAGGSFVGTANDTISIRVPAYINARTRVLRGGRPITMDSVAETKVDVTLDTDVYKAIEITDEELTLDIVSFGDQILMPAVRSVARGVEDHLADTMIDATYETTVDLTESDPYLGIVDARIALNDAFVPASNRFLVVGSNVEAALLKSDRLSNYINAGDNTALRAAVIGSIAGFLVMPNPKIDPDTAIAAHQTAFVLSMQAPIVPAGVTWGSSASYAGLAMRVIRDYDFLNVQDRLLADVFVGSESIKDRGTFGSDGKFIPSEDGEDDPILVRAVKLELTGS
jgi:hypothetical protein